MPSRNTRGNKKPYPNHSILRSCAIHYRLVTDYISCKDTFELPAFFHIYILPCTILSPFYLSILHIACLHLKIHHPKNLSGSSFLSIDFNALIGYERWNGNTVMAQEQVAPVSEMTMEQWGEIWASQSFDKMKQWIVDEFLEERISTREMNDLICLHATTECFEHKWLEYEMEVLLELNIMSTETSRKETFKWNIEPF